LKDDFPFELGDFWDPCEEKSHQRWSSLLVFQTCRLLARVATGGTPVLWMAIRFLPQINSVANVFVAKTLSQ